MWSEDDIEAPEDEGAVVFDFTVADCSNSGRVEAFGKEWFVTKPAAEAWRDRAPIEGALRMTSGDTAIFEVDGESIEMLSSDAIDAECTLWPEEETTAAEVSQREESTVVDADETKLADVYRQCGNLRFDGPVDQELVLDPIPDDVRLILDAEIDRIGADDLATDQVQWFLVSRSAERISVGFKRPNGDADSYTEGHLDLTDDGWRSGGWGPCEIRFAVDGKQELRWQLDAPIAPATETISALAVEQFCGSQPALTPGDIQPLIIETSQRVTVLLVAPNSDNDELSCLVTSAIPITVNLGQPLGDRELHDGGGVAISSLRSSPN